jgi:hypothetical protein
MERRKARRSRKRAPKNKVVAPPGAPSPFTRVKGKLPKPRVQIAPRERQRLFEIQIDAVRDRKNKNPALRRGLQW